MSDILRLDPFQMARSFTVPEPSAELVVIPNVLDLSKELIDFDFEQTLTLCVGGQVTFNANGMWRLRSLDTSRALSGPLYNCEQLDPQTLIGRTSGERWPTFGDKKIFLGFPACGESSCFVELTAADPGGPGYARWRFRDQGGFSILQWEQWLTAEPPLINNEDLDLEMPVAPRLPILTIRDSGTFFQIRVETTVPHQLAAGHYVNIEGTAFHDVVQVSVEQIYSPTELRIARSWVADEDDSGIIQANYLENIF